MPSTGISGLERVLALRPALDGGQGCGNIRMNGDDLVEPGYLKDLLYIRSKRTDVESAVLLLEVLPEAQEYT